MTSVQKEGKQDIFQKITARIVKEVEQGNIPWLQPWRNRYKVEQKQKITLDIADIWPTNAMSGNQYGGGNVLALWIHMAELKLEKVPMLFCTFKQARAMGGSVKRGEKGCNVVGYRQGSREVEDDDGEKTTKSWSAPFGHVVFHLSQTEGCTLPVRREPKQVKDPEPIGLDNKKWQAWVKAVGVTIRHGGNEAKYLIGPDVVLMPSADQFHTPNMYRGVAYHEIVHWSGNEKRLDRFKVWKPNMQSPEYAFEELIAEIGAAFLCARNGIAHTELRHAGYVKHWLQHIKDDPKAIMRAASAAQKAVKFIEEKAGAALKPKAKRGSKAKGREGKAVGTTVQSPNGSRGLAGGKKGSRAKSSRSKAAAMVA